MQNKELEEIQESKKAYDALVAAKGKDALGNLIAAMFKACTDLAKVHWRQYTPHFNDGEACEFTVYDRTYERADGTELRLWERKPELQPLHALDAMFEPFEDILFVLFGDHVEITAEMHGSAAIFTTEECEHD
jgi:hypothetical protein